MIECEGLGLGIQVNEETGTVGLLISLAERESDEDAVAFVVVKPEDLDMVGTKFVALMAEMAHIQAALSLVAEEERPGALQEIVARMQAGTN